MVEHQTVALLLGRYVKVGRAPEPVGEDRQLGVVRGKERVGAHRIVQVLGRGRRNGQPVVGARSPTHFIEQDKRAVVGRIQDVGEFLGLDEKGAAAPREIVVRPDASIDALEDR